MVGPGVAVQVQVGGQAVEDRLGRGGGRRLVPPDTPHVADAGRIRYGLVVVGLADAADRQLLRVDDVRVGRSQVLTERLEITFKCGVAPANRAAVVDLCKVGSPRLERLRVLLVVVATPAGGAAAAGQLLAGDRADTLVQPELESLRVDLGRQPGNAVREICGVPRQRAVSGALGRHPAVVKVDISVASRRQTGAHQLVRLVEQ